MISHLFFIIISSSSLFSTVHGQHSIERQATGDLLHGADLNCTLRGASQVSHGKCVCAGSGSYYTDRNGRSNCFKGRGEEELGKIVNC